MGNKNCFIKRTSPRGGDELDRTNSPRNQPPQTQQTQETKKVRTDDRDKQMLQMKLQRDGLQRHRKKVTSLAKDDELKAKEILVNSLSLLSEAEKKKARDKASFLLKKRIHHEKLASQVDTALLMLNKMIDDTEFSLVQAETVKALDQGNKLLKCIQNEMGGADKVQNLMEEMDELSQANDEISRLLCGPEFGMEESALNEDIEKQMLKLSGELDREREYEVMEKLTDMEVEEVAMGLKKGDVGVKGGEKAKVEEETKVNAEEAGNLKAVEEKKSESRVKERREEEMLVAA